MRNKYDTIKHLPNIDKWSGLTMEEKAVHFSRLGDASQTVFCLEHSTNPDLNRNLIAEALFNFASQIEERDANNPVVPAFRKTAHKYFSSEINSKQLLEEMASAQVRHISQIKSRAKVR